MASLPRALRSRSRSCGQCSVSCDLFNSTAIVPSGSAVIPTPSQPSSPSRLSNATAGDPIGLRVAVGASNGGSATIEYSQVTMTTLWPLAASLTKRVAAGSVQLRRDGPKALTSNLFLVLCGHFVFRRYRRMPRQLRRRTSPATKALGSRYRSDSRRSQYPSSVTRTTSKPLLHTSWYRVRTDTRVPVGRTSRRERLGEECIALLRITRVDA